MGKVWNVTRALSTILEPLSWTADVTAVLTVVSHHAVTVSSIEFCFAGLSFCLPMPTPNSLCSFLWVTLVVCPKGNALSPGELFPLIRDRGIFIVTCTSKIHTQHQHKRKIMLHAVTCYSSRQISDICWNIWVTFQLQWNHIFWNTCLHCSWRR